jgi:transcription elongation factor GreB
MSRAFVKEDTDPPERSGRVRSASGLPPGALNYTTPAGERRLQERIAKLQRDAASSADHSEEIAHLQRVLASVTVIVPASPPPEAVAFGATVQVRDPDGKIETYRIVGVDEVEFEQGAAMAVSWISPLAKALLGAEVDDRVQVEGDKRTLAIAKIDYEQPLDGKSP